jgi:hypothetical protein
MVRKCLRDSGDVVLGKGKLAKLRLKATRSGVWFRALRRVDRALVDVTLRVCDRVLSYGLARALLLVVARLENAMGRKFSDLVASVGLKLAFEASRTGVKLGNGSARRWASDLSFARFLTMMYINSRSLSVP